MNGNDRNLVKMIKEIGEEDGIKIVGSKDGWIFRLTKNNMNKHIIGHRFELNTKEANAICDHKSSASNILLKENIPAVEHKAFLSPENIYDINQYEHWQKMLDYLKLHQKIVVKPNDGSMGYNVMKVSTEEELESALIKIFPESKYVALSPYYHIDAEYRVIVLDEEVKLIYLKQPPFIIGNGKDSILTLITNSKENLSITQIDEDIDLNYIPKDKEEVYLNWKHNSTFGSSGKIINEGKIVEKLTTLSLEVMDKLGLVFASIDIIGVDNDYLVLEVNAGVMMEQFSKTSDENYKIAKEIYNDAIDLMFGEY